MDDLVDLVRRALDEDIGSGDVTSHACVPADRQASGFFLARESLVLAGTEILKVIYPQNLVLLRHDGDHLNEGDRIATVHGNARGLLECERVALNFLQRLSGVATLGHASVTQWKERIAKFSIRAKPRQDCAGWKKQQQRPEASLTIGWVSTTPF